MSFGSKKRLVEELKNKKFRDAYVAEHVKTSVPIQIYVLREQRHWNQTQLAELAKTTQTVISRLEDQDYGRLSISSLLKLASAFDVALLVKFVPFTRLFEEFEDTSPEALAATSFTEELEDIAAWAEDDDRVEQKERPAVLSNPLSTNNFEVLNGWIEIQKQNLPNQQTLQTGASGAATGVLSQVSGAHLGNISDNIRYSSPTLRGAIGYGTLERH
jgi:transcriptional regulator with XRE-family HTH domain